MVKYFFAANTSGPYRVLTDNTVQPCASRTSMHSGSMASRFRAQPMFLIVSSGARAGGGQNAQVSSLSRAWKAHDPAFVVIRGHWPTRDQPRGRVIGSLVALRLPRCDSRSLLQSAMTNPQ